MIWTGGRARFRRPYSTARFTIVATLFQFSPYWRAVPCQLNSRASTATALDSAVVTRAHGSAQGQSSTPTPPRGQSPPPWTVAQFQSQLPHRDITPLSFFADVMNLQASLPANPAAQQPPPEPVDPHQHALVRLLHLGYGMGFQTQLFSDKGLNEHLGSILSYSLVGNTKLTRYRGALQTRAGLQLLHFKVVQPPLHFSERNQKHHRWVFSSKFFFSNRRGTKWPACAERFSIAATRRIVVKADLGELVRC